MRRPAIPLLTLACMVCAPTWTSAAPPAPDLKATLEDDLKTLQVPLVPDYAKTHPRLLFSAGDLAALAAKAKAQPDLWKEVLASSRRLGSAPPDADVIKNGTSYWRIERVQSAALAYFVTGDKKNLEAALPWMLAYAKEPVWGTLFRPNIDLAASWYLYHLAIAYDIFYPDLSEADRKTIRDSLASHAKAIYDDLNPAGRTERDNYRYEQNHTYIPATAMAAASLAVLDEVPEAKDYLKRAYGVMRRARYAQGEDGYYYEGYGYWSYALHWHVRYADLIARATGEKAHDLPVLRDNWLFALHLSLPGHPGGFDIGDIGTWSGVDRKAVSPNNYAALWGVAGVMGIPQARTAADLYHGRAPDRDYPAATFLWFPEKVSPAPMTSIKPYHYFADHDVVTWRSGWDADATCLLFRCGPPEGHKAAAKLSVMKDWTMNAGHVHPDIGAFYLYAKETYMAVSTGYTAEKWTRDHNTVLIDGKGQGLDGTYHNDRGFPYEKLDKARIDRVHLADGYAFASGTFGSAYARAVPDADMRRSVLATKRWLLIIDDLAGDKAHTLTWFCHADAEFKADGKAYVATLSKAKLAVLPLTSDNATAKPDRTVVAAGTAPGKGTPTHRGFHLALETPAGKSIRMVNLLVPLDLKETPPSVTASKLDGDQISLDLTWADGRKETVKVNLKWSGDSSKEGPAQISAP